MITLNAIVDFFKNKENRKTKGFEKMGARILIRKSKTHE